MDRDKYEYVTLTLGTSGRFWTQIDQDYLADQLNRAGDEGWELVNTFPVARMNGRTMNVVHETQKEFIVINIVNTRGACDYDNL